MIVTAKHAPGIRVPMCLFARMSRHLEEIPKSGTAGFRGFMPFDFVTVWPTAYQRNNTNFYPTPRSACFPVEYIGGS